LEAPKPAAKTNRIGLQVLDYRGGKTTLCAGCGHNAISERIIDAFYEMGVQPERLMKLSGIGCSSKSPAYFMSRSHSFTACMGACRPLRRARCWQPHHEGTGSQRRRRHRLHWRGTVCAPHAAQRPVIYVIEDNGVYGLTKGQFSATADIGSKLKTGVIMICAD